MRNTTWLPNLGVNDHKYFWHTHLLKWVVSQTSCFSGDLHQHLHVMTSVLLFSVSECKMRFNMIKINEEDVGTSAQASEDVGAQSLELRMKWMTLPLNEEVVRRIPIYLTFTNNEFSNALTFPKKQIDSPKILDS